jgi:hypothetical protein
MNDGTNSVRDLEMLSQALLTEQNNSIVNIDYGKNFSDFSEARFAELRALAASQHVILRTFPALQRALEAQRSDSRRWIDRAIAQEEARVHHALSFLFPICQALGKAGNVIVIKSLDHWPDLGSDLDLYTNASAAEVISIMRESFRAHTADRSWGDLLANKWNFIVPGLSEPVEVHVSRLGQTGEQVAVTQSLVARAGPREFGPHTFTVPAHEDRMIISTLQRMYRHFYFRLCDIVDTAHLVDSGAIN